MVACSSSELGMDALFLSFIEFILLFEIRMAFTEEEIQKLQKKLTQKNHPRRGLPEDFLPFLKKEIKEQRKQKRHQKQAKKYQKLKEQEAKEHSLPYEDFDNSEELLPVLNDIHTSNELKKISPDSKKEKGGDESIPSKLKSQLVVNSKNIAKITKQTKARALLIRHAILDGTLGQDNDGYEELVQWIYDLREEHPALFVRLMTHISDAVKEEDYAQHTKVTAPIVINLNAENPQYRPNENSIIDI